MAHGLVPVNARRFTAGPVRKRRPMRRRPASLVQRGVRFLIRTVLMFDSLTPSTNARLPAVGPMSGRDPNGSLIGAGRKPEGRVLKFLGQVALVAEPALSATRVTGVPSRANDRGRDPREPASDTHAGGQAPMPGERGGSNKTGLMPQNAGESRQLDPLDISCASM